MSNNNAAAAAALDALLDGDLDDLADLPSFKPYPAGVHHVSLELVSKVVNNANAFEAQLKYINPVELADATETEPAAGDKTSALFTLGNDVGQGKFKNLCKQLGEMMGGVTNLRAIIEGTKGGFDCNIVSKVRTDAKDTDKQYMEIVSVSPA